MRMNDIVTVQRSSMSWAAWIATGRPGRSTAGGEGPPSRPRWLRVESTIARHPYYSSTPLDRKRIGGRDATPGAADETGDSECVQRGMPNKTLRRLDKAKVESRLSDFRRPFAGRRPQIIQFRKPSHYCPAGEVRARAPQVRSGTRNSQGRTSADEASIPAGGVECLRKGSTPRIVVPAGSRSGRRNRNGCW